MRVGLKSCSNRLVLRAWFLAAALAGCGRLIDEDADLWPPPDSPVNEERRDPESFDPCPRLEVDAPIALSSSGAAEGTSDPRIAWNQDTLEFMVVWREGTRVAFQRLAPDGRPIGLEGTVREPDGTPVIADGDPAVLAVTGHSNAPFFLAVQRGHELSIDRLLPGREEVAPPFSSPLPDAVLADGVARESRIPSMSSDGARLAVVYRTSEGAQLTSLRLQDFGPACDHETSDDPPVCQDGTNGTFWPAAVGWLPPMRAVGDLEEDDAAGALEPAWWMAVRIPVSRSLEWLSLQPTGGVGSALEERNPTVHIGSGAQNVDHGPRIATGNRRLALAVRRGQGQAEAWQVTDDATTACVLSAPELSAGVPAIAWAHGRRLAVVGLWPRPSGDVDVVVARGDAPVTEADRELARDRACPAPLDLTRVTRDAHVAARDPDVAFSGDGLGITWAQATSADAPADVWFALARCVP